MAKVDELEHDDEDLANFDVGFQAALDGQQLDRNQPAAWLRGYESASKDRDLQEHD